MTTTAPRFLISLLTLLAWIAPVHAAVVTATYNNASDVAVADSSYTATGNTVNLTLNHTPTPGSILMVVKNYGPAFINGQFGNLAHGQKITLSYGGVNYPFVANYYGGTGNDLVLQWAETRAFGWGSNHNGQLGTPSPVQANLPVPAMATGVLAGKVITSLATGHAHTLALCSDGTVAAWGWNSNGQLGNNSTTTSSVPVAVDLTGNLAGKKVIAIAAGYAHSLALCSDGTVAGWGSSSDNQLGYGGGTDMTVPFLVVDSSGVFTGKTVVAIAAGGFHSMALLSDGTVATWGRALEGQIGNGTGLGAGSAYESSPRAVSTVGVLAGKTVIAIAAGQYHSLALCSDSTVAAWGANGYGQLGDSSFTSSTLPVAVNRTGVLSGKTVTSLVAGHDHSLALCSDGSLAAWGNNGDGELGNNGVTNSKVPVAVSTSGVLSGKTVSSIAAGRYHCLALCSDGTLTSWGMGMNGQLGDSTLLDSRVPVAVRSTPLGAGARFMLLGTGCEPVHSAVVTALPLTPTVTSVSPNSGPVIGGTTVTVTGQNFYSGMQVAFGGKEADNIIVVNDTTLTCTTPGNNTGSVGVFATTAAGTSSVTAGSVYNYSGLNLVVNYTSANQVPVATPDPYAWGGTVNLTLGFAPQPGTELMLVKNTGAAFFGKNGTPGGYFNNLVQGQTVMLLHNDVAYFFVADYYGGSGNDLVLHWKGTSAFAWGRGDLGALGNNDTFNSSSMVPVNTATVLAGKTLIATAAGANHSLALCSDGTLVAWGHNASVQLGTTGLMVQSVPVAVDTDGVLSGRKVIAIAAGDGHSLALTSDGLVTAWGANAYGQLGNNSTTTGNTLPVEVVRDGSALSGKTVIAIAAGLGHSLALCSDGTVAAWGDNTYGQLGTLGTAQSSVPVAVNTSGVLAGRKVVAIAAGTRHNLVLCSDGTVVAWGDNTNGQLGNNTTIPSASPVLVSTSGVLAGKTVTSLKAGFTHSLALCSDGTLAAWGGNDYGQLGNNSTAQMAVPVAVDMGGILAGKTVSQIAAGAAHCLALCSDGTAAAWGLNFYYALGSDSGSFSPLPIAISTSSLGGGNRLSSLTTGFFSYHNLALVASQSQPEPFVTSITPSTGSASGGSVVIINGVNLGGATGVSFGGIPASFAVGSSTQITAVVPEGVAAGPVGVGVLTPGGWNAEAPLYTYTINSAPSFNLRPDMVYDAGLTWTVRTGAGSRTWRSIASSADGNRLAAVSNYGEVTLSLDAGVTWMNRTIHGSYSDFMAVASSADGQKLAAAHNNGPIFTSTDGGTTWTQRPIGGTWRGIASSADGAKLVAVGLNGYIHTSTDSGATWAQRASSRMWLSVASSADGTKLIAGSQDGIFTSADSGVTWTLVNNNSGTAVASSADGTRLASATDGWRIQISTDSGVTWTPRGPQHNWVTITSSADGMRLAAAGSYTKVYTSIDGGDTWTVPASDPAWNSIASLTSSADGNRLAAAGFNNYIYTSAAQGVSVLATSGAHTTLGFAINVSAGPSADAGQTVSFTVTNSDNTLFSVQPAISSDGTLTFTPSGLVGTAIVTVTAVDNGGTFAGGSNTSTSKTFPIYFTPPPPPVITSVSLASGSTLGGTSVTISGSNFTGATSVTFSGTPATQVNVVNANTITCVTPAGSAGGSSVLVTTVAGSNSGNSHYTYTTSSPGTPDSLSLGITGTAQFPSAYGMAVQPNGKIIIVGDFTQVLGTSRNSVARINADGTLDTGFNPNVSGYVVCAAVQADGKVLLGGNFTTVGGQARASIARVNADGSLDSGFDPGANSEVMCMGVQRDGKILLGGGFTTVGGVSRGRIARLNADGTVDAAFNPNVNAYVYGMALQTDGKVLLTGDFSNVAGQSWGGTARVNADGSLDTSFNGPSGGRCVAVQADGKVIIGGTFNYATEGVYRPSLARFNANGTLDAAFNPNPDHYISSIAVQADGKFLIAGSFTTIGGVTRSRVARLNTDGTVDTSFNANGVSSNPRSVALDTSGRVLLAGNFTSVGGYSRSMFARLDNTPASQVLTAADRGQVTWTRAGTAPELAWVAFDVSTDGGSTWTPAGVGVRSGITANWSYAGSLLPASGHLRARAAYASGAYTGGGSGSFIEQVASFSGLALPAPTLASLTPASGPAQGGASVTITGTGFASPASVSIGGTAATNVTVVNDTTITCTTPVGSAGTASVLVTTSGGTNVANTLYTYLPLPTLTNVSPAVGLFTGSTSVTITGTGFTGATAVTFGGTAATSFTVVSGTQITATTPAHVLGTASVEITAPGGTNAANTAFFFSPPPPTISNVTPNSGPVEGGTNITITGTNLQYFDEVRIGTVPATNVVVVNDTTLTATTAAGAAGTYTISLIGAYSGANPGATFSYLAAPTVANVSPNSGLISGGTNVTITGTNFTGATSVTFGGTNAASFTVNSATEITATTPAHSPGAASVLVTTAGGTNAANTAFFFSPPPPTISNVTPSSGPEAGGTNITITGTNLQYFDEVRIGTVPATNVVVVNDTTLTATTAAGTPGTYTISLIGAYSGANPGATFTYLAAPTVANVSPNSGLVSGGTNVTITGTNFTGATSVTFGGTNAASFTVNSATQITATTPAHSPGDASVLVTTAGGTNAANTAFFFSPPPPTISNITPNSGPVVGGTNITITGTNLQYFDEVRIGTASATNVVIVNDTTLTATTAAEMAGTYEVKLLGPYSSINTGVSFTYNASPTDISLNPASLAENNAANATVGTLSATDLDEGDMHTFSLVSGEGDTDNASFTLDGTALKITPVADFETKPSYSLRVRAIDDNGGTFAKALTVTITDGNDAPTAIVLTPASIAEINAPNATVGTLSATDADAGATHTFSLVNGTGDTDNASVTLSGSSVKLIPVADFETKASYSIRVQADDGNGGVFAQALVITITDVTEGTLKPLTVSLLPNIDAGTLTFSPALGKNSQAVVGRQYKVTAKAKLGWFFQSWGGKTAGTSLSTTFTFAEGDTVVATFTPTPFTDTVAGLYNGIVKGSTAETDTQANAGLFSATLTKNTGAFTGKVLLDGTTAPIAGVFNNETKQFTSPALTNGFVTSLTLDIANARITGTITQMRRGSPVGVIDIGAPKGYSKTDLPAAGLTGAYNLAFTAPTAPATLLADEYPHGNGYGVLTISSTDASAKLAGVLADGTAYTSAAVLCKTNVAPLYASFATRIGALVGTATVDTAPATTDATGAGLRWFRSINKGQYYPWGYDTGLTINLIGAKQTSSTQASLALSGTPSVEFSGGPFTALVSQLLGTATKGFLSTDKATSLSFSSTGLMTGSHTPAGTTAKHLIKGIIVGKPGTPGQAYGHILTPAPAHTNGAGLSGKVEVKP